MGPNQPQLDEHGFPIPPTFAGQADRRGQARSLGRFVWRAVLVLVFLVLLGTAAVREGTLDWVKARLAEQLIRRAAGQAQDDNLPAALANLDRAVAWAPDEPNAFYVRGQVRLAINDVQGSLDDFNRLIQLNERFAPAYQLRSTALQRLGRHREAIDDLTRAIELSPAHDATSRNNRAYARALAGIELDEGLADVQAALAKVEQELIATPNVPQNMRLMIFLARPQHEKAMYLDTRGTIQLLRGQYAAALGDLEEAIELAESSTRLLYDRSPRAQKLRDRELAVMYHHRGQIHQMLGHAEQAKADLDQGMRLGYDPAGGVY